MELKSILVKKPRKTHHCYVCSGEITGEHVYAVSVIDGEFYYGRFHLKCDNQIKEMCGCCKYNDDCQMDMATCFDEKIREVK